MTVVNADRNPGRLARVSNDLTAQIKEVSVGKINSRLSIGVDVAAVVRLAANMRLACPGVQLSGQGFVLSPTEVKSFSERTQKYLIRGYVTGRDLTQGRREQYVLDTLGLTEEQLRRSYPDAYQRLVDYVKPEREHNPRPKYAREWWLHSEGRRKFRAALERLSRFICTSRTSRHRIFEFLPSEFLPETKVLIIALDTALHLGVLSSRFHTVFAAAAGGWLGVGNDSTYNHSGCFEPFPFPDATDTQQSRIRDLGEQLDAHRKRQQEQHPGLTMTGMYNVLEKLRAGERLNAKDQAIHEQGLVSVLRQIHDELDAAVADAYGWPVDLTDEEILERLVALNRQRADEERRGLIRWLRPEFQNPEGRTQQAVAAESEETPVAVKKAAAGKQPWPGSLPAQVAAVQAALAELAAPVDETQIAKHFTRANKDRVAELLETLAALGKVRELEDGRYVPV